jgi:anti-sigma B factor antagonist
MGLSGNSGLDVRCERNGDGAVVVVARGDLDIATAPELNHALASPDATGSVVVLDLRAVAFIDSSGLSVIAGQHQRAKEQGARFAVAVGGAPHVQRLISLSGLSATLELVEDASELIPR